MRMRTFLLTVILVPLYAVHAQGPVRVEKAGLISELAYLKFCAEYVTSTVLSDPRTIDLGSLTKRPAGMERKEYEFLVDSVVKVRREERRSAALPVVQAYMELKVLSDQWMLQLVGDIRRKNSNKPYKQMDDILKEKALAKVTKDTTMLPRIQYLQKIDSAFVDLKAAADLYLNGSPMAAFGEIGVPGLDDFVTLFAGISERRKGKADELVGILMGLRIAELNELASPKLRAETK